MYLSKYPKKPPIIHYSLRQSFYIFAHIQSKMAVRLNFLGIPHPHPGFCGKRFFILGWIEKYLEIWNLEYGSRRWGFMRPKNSEKIWKKFSSPRLRDFVTFLTLTFLFQVLLIFKNKDMQNWWNLHQIWSWNK